ncbi:hypothetical protein SETIT_6G064800v2 [Setaria italica]|uniref:Uncharacterized protein n=1 Tax=Setaria italica TaxID=4555 RepID=A0A368RIW3_SETIT|nr:hypothetical protein SETIT_6G064800v2 [Setaria italica]
MAGQNGWVPEGRRIITSKFNEKFPVAHFTKKQVQEKEKELKANYKALRDAKRDSVDPPSTPAPPVAPAVPPLAPPVERNNSEQSSSHLGANPFASSFDGQETSSAHNEHNEAQDSRQEEGGSGTKHKQSHIGSALEGYMEYKKSQTSKTLQAFEERKRREEEFSVEKCVDPVDAMVK